MFFYMESINYLKMVLNELFNLLKRKENNYLVLYVKINLRG